MGDEPAIYRRLGVRRVIHGSGTTTRYGGSILRPEALETMHEAIVSTRLREELDRKSTRLNSSHIQKSRMPSSA